MSKKTYILTAISLLLIVFGVLVSEYSEFARLWRVRQTIRLTPVSLMYVRDACVYQADLTHELIRVYVRYEGEDPNRDYLMRAEIGRSASDTAFAQIWHWQVPLPGTGMERFWEFQNFPRDGRPFYIRIYMRPKSGGPEVVRTFKLPDRLRPTPNGESPHYAKAADGSTAEQNGCRQRLEGYLSCQQRLALAVA